MVVDRLKTLMHKIPVKMREQTDYLMKEPSFMTFVKELLTNVREKNTRQELAEIAKVSQDIDRIREFILEFPVIRSFVSKDDVAELDLHQRREILKLADSESDPMRDQYEKRKLTRTRAEKTQKRRDQNAQQSDDGDGDAEREQDSDDEKTVGATISVWPMPQRVQVNARVVCGDFFDTSVQIPKQPYRLVLLDGPYGLHRFRGDQEWSLDVVSAMNDYP